MLTNCESDTCESKLVSLVTNEHHYVEQQKKLTNNNQHEVGGEIPELKEAPEEIGCSSSGSSWNPDQGDQGSTESDSSVHEIPCKKIKNDPDKQSKSKEKKPRGPSLKAEAVLPQGWLHSRVLKENAQYRNMLNKKRQEKNDNKKTPLPKQTEKSSKSPNNSAVKSNQQCDNGNGNIKNDEISHIKIVLGEVTMIREILQELRMLSNTLCTSLNGQIEELLQEKTSISLNTLEGATLEDIPNNPVVNVKNENINPSMAEILEKISQHQSFTEINQNVETPLKTVKPKQYRAKKRPLAKDRVDYRVDDEEMMPIGSGKTLVPKHMYDKIDWKTYTGATRKLLMAVFTRRILATHSLTGKASPAFLHKPAKLCLDPRKVQDIVMTVTSKCQVKESLVRSAITTKCADENKMLKMQMKKTLKTTIPQTPEDSKGDALQQETTPANDINF